LPRVPGSPVGAAPAMKRDERLRRRNDFAAVYRNGRTQSNQLLVLRVLPNDREMTRFGFVVGKTVGGAVVRNRVKRRLREAARGLPVMRGYDVVIGARKLAADAPFEALRGALVSLSERSRICRESPKGAP
jgi:ribonuclease P protein component